MSSLTNKETLLVGADLIRRDLTTEGELPSQRDFKRKREWT